jgi:segregation and condensation protein B
MSPGRPVTWLTTPEFLDHFGLETVKDLPGVDELKSAGLLDTRPAIQAFRGIVDTEAETDEDAEADAEEADGDEEVIDLSSEPSIADAADAAEEEPEGEEPGDQAPEELADQQDDAGEIVRQAR